MSIFAKLDKKERRVVFSGHEFTADKMPSGEIMPDHSILTCTKEGWNTFRMVSCPSGKSPYGSRAIWRCDVGMKNDSRIADRAIELREIVIG